MEDAKKELLDLISEAASDEEFQQSLAEFILGDNKVREAIRQIVIDTVTEELKETTNEAFEDLLAVHGKHRLPDGTMIKLSYRGVGEDD